ncbi:sigma factor-like helix-turn-helix DNA-binding protein [Paenibacillus vortex]|nr:sigma factor-like helix-turn-helix DNA-binding protein [Paenibacillus vortex]
MDHVMSLPFKYKSVIHLFYYEDYSVKEIAGILQINESAVKMRLQRGRKLLRMDLEGEDD